MWRQGGGQVETRWRSRGKVMEGTFMAEDAEAVTAEAEGQPRAPSRAAVTATVPGRRGRPDRRVPLARRKLVSNREPGRYFKPSSQ